MAQVPIVRAEDSRNGMIAAGIFITIVLFLLFFITYTEPFPPKVTVPVPIILGEAGIEEFEINSAGGGSPNESVSTVPVAKEEPEEKATQEESEVKINTGTGSSKNKNKTSNETSHTNLFSGNNTGGSGNLGSGGGFGEDDGPNSGGGEVGGGGGGDRVRETNITSKPQTQNSLLCKVALKLTVNSEGTVLRADVISKETTATDQKLINEIVQLAKKEVRYKKKPGAGDETVFYTVVVHPN